MQTETLVSNAFQKWKGKAAESLMALPVSGSDRRYFRLALNGESFIAAYNEMRPENTAFVTFDTAFRQLGIRVPEVLHIEEDGLLYFLEDLGDETLLDLVKKIPEGQDFPDEIMEIYRKALEQLAVLQVRGAEKVNFDLCWNGSRFDGMHIRQDLHYFKYCFLKPSGISFNDWEMEQEFELLVHMIEELPGEYFMFRDFQARNIMVKEGQPYFIDFQGGMKGPVQYDVASLLNQARASLPEEQKSDLLDHYLKKLKGLIPLNETRFMRGYSLCQILRLLQVLGAYGFRGNFEGKTHFKESIPFAITQLQRLLDKGYFPENMPYLKALLVKLSESVVPAKSNPTKHDTSKLLSVSIASFSYKKGIPADDSGNGGGFVFDCRGIENPGRQENFKSLSGKDLEVIRFLNGLRETGPYFSYCAALVSSTVENYLERGFSNLAVNFGCTGGQHRSVYFAEKMAKFLEEKFNVNVTLQHCESSNWVKEKVTEK